MKEFRYTITEPTGIHARPAGQLVKVAKQCSSMIQVIKGNKSAVATKQIALMGLCAQHGDTVTVRIEGNHEDEDAAVLEAFFRENL